MIAVPALDLRGGHCVQLVGGRPEEERVSLSDPVGVAERWASAGFESLHVVDLDAALGSGDNSAVTQALFAASVASDVQVGGGVRTDERAETLLRAGAARVVVGTRGIDDPAWLEQLTRHRPHRVVLAVDTRAGTVLRKGWTEETSLRAATFLPTLAGLPLAGVLWTDVGREGRLEGIDRRGCRRVIEASPHPVWISGGVTTVDDMAYLEDVGAHAVVLGMALYTGRLDPATVASRWGEAAARRAAPRPLPPASAMDTEVPGTPRESPPSDETRR